MEKINIEPNQKSDKYENFRISASDKDKLKEITEIKKITKTNFFVQAIRSVYNSMKLS